MRRLIVEPAFWELFPDALIGVLTVHGIDNTANAERCGELMLHEAAETAKLLAETEEIGSHPAVAPWRAAYAKFGVKPSKYRSSIEGMLRSAKSGRLRPVNPLVDLYNAISLRHMLPAGGEDLASLEGDVRLTRAVGDEHFMPIGAEELEPPPAGAVIYRDDLGVICSCWNWREADRTKLTEQTTDAILVIEALPPITAHQVEAALLELSWLITANLGGTASVAIADQAHPEITIV